MSSDGAAPRCCLPFATTGARHSLLCGTNRVPVRALPDVDPAQSGLEAAAYWKTRSGIVATIGDEERDWELAVGVVQRIGDWTPEPRATFTPELWPCCRQRVVESHAPWCARAKPPRARVPMEHAW